MIGKDVNIKENRFSLKKRSSDQLFITQNAGSHFSYISFLSLLLNAAVSTDPFFMGNGFRCGIIESILIGLVTLLLTFASFHLFTRTWIDGSTVTYTGIFGQAFNEKYEFIISIMLLLSF